MTHLTEDQFAAALAHQLKTPVSALQAASRNLRRNLRGLLEDLASMAGQTAPSAATARFISRAVSEPAPAPLTGLLPEDRVLAIAERLAGLGLDGDVRASAASLVRGAWDTYLDEIAPLLKGDASLALDILETAARLRANLAAVDAALARVTGVASALRLLARPAEGGRVDIARSIESSLSMIREMLPAAVTLSARLRSMPPAAGQADLLAEVWSNLVANAAQAVGETGAIVIEGGPIGADRLEVRVIDDGPGISAELLPRIFDRFFTTRAMEGGSGLGLPLARQIVERLGGTIEVTSRPGRTCFAVQLPAAGAVAGAEA